MREPIPLLIRTATTEQGCAEVVFEWVAVQEPLASTANGAMRRRKLPDAELRGPREIIHAHAGQLEEERNGSSCRVRVSLAPSAEQITRDGRIGGTPQFLPDLAPDSL